MFGKQGLIYMYTWEGIRETNSKRNHGIDITRKQEYSFHLEKRKKKKEEKYALSGQGN